MDLKTQFNEYRTIPIGLVGENNYRKIHINVSDIIQEYPNARFEVILQREGDAAPYPVVTQLNGTDLIWIVSDVDVAVKGRAKAEIIAFNDDVIAKSKIFFVNVEASLDPSGDIPEPLDEWYSDILNASSMVRADAAEVIAAKDIVVELAKEIELSGGMPVSIYDPQHKRMDIFGYIDNEVAAKANKPTVMLDTLYANRWNDGVYSFESVYPYSDFEVVLFNPTSTCSDEAWDAYKALEPAPIENENRLRARGTVPEVDIPVVIGVIKK